MYQYQILEKFKIGDIVVNMNKYTYNYGKVGVISEIKKIYSTLTVNYDGINTIGVPPQDLLNISTSWVEDRIL